MPDTRPHPEPWPRGQVSPSFGPGCVICDASPHDPAAACALLLQRLELPELADAVAASCTPLPRGSGLWLRLRPELAQAWTPDYDTLGLAERLHLDTTTHPRHLLREIVVAMLAGPVALEFPSLEEMLSAIRIRANIVRAARRTTLAFHTAEAERPSAYWRDDEDVGFVIRRDVSLIDALEMATQPERSGALYAFSCYRASEYVIVLGLAQELQHCNPALYAQLQDQWRRRPIRSGVFHEVFLIEQGSMEAPLPPTYFVPGDRTWFRNPDPVSAEASGFEGSWVMYLGSGLFNNFWKRDAPYTLDAKCLEVYHWRHGLYLDAEGEERINEDQVEICVEATKRDPAEHARILALMKRYREPRGIYTDAGGCIDTTREFARWVCPGSADLVLPAV